MPRNIEYIPFPDVREILRQEVAINNIAIWGAEGISEQSFNDETDIFVIPAPVSWDDIDAVKKAFRDAAIANLPLMNEVPCAYRTGDKIIMPPVFERYKDRLVLSFGYAAFFAIMEENEDEQFIFPMIEVRRATMKQVQPTHTPVKLTSLHFDDYLAMEAGHLNPAGKTKIFLNPEKYIL